MLQFYIDNRNNYITFIDKSYSIATDFFFHTLEAFCNFYNQWNV